LYREELDVTLIDPEEIKTAYKKAFKTTSTTGFHFGDEVYKPLNPELLKEFLKIDPIDKREYVENYRDCEDFSFMLFGEIRQDGRFDGCPIFITWMDTSEGGHSVLSYFYNDKIYLLEPQTDEITGVDPDFELWDIFG
jgi:hypothetical protein